MVIPLKEHLILSSNDLIFGKNSTMEMTGICLPKAPSLGCVKFTSRRAACTGFKDNRNSEFARRLYSACLIAKGIKPNIDLITLHFHPKTAASLK